MSAKDFCVCVLLYGDFPHLAERVLSSVSRLQAAGATLRIATNEIGAATEELLDKMEIQPEVLERSAGNSFKYPMMRRLLQDRPTPHRFVMWFDDDSYLSPAVSSAEDWLNRYAYIMRKGGMCGSQYTMSLQGKQHEWIVAQPWYAGKPVSARQVVRFCTGGWWAIPTAVLLEHDWPSREIRHRGGDVMLGELCRQQGIPLLVSSKFGVHINADEEGRECKSKRRGFDEKPVGYYGVNK